MTSEILQSLLTTISATADLTTLILNSKELGLKISGKTLKSIQKDKKTIIDILSECFIRKEVLWQRFDWENGYWCYNSLIELQRKCDDYCSKFLTTSDDKQYFFYQLMRLWGNNCNEAYKELFRQNTSHQSDLSKPLRKVRVKTYPIVVTLIQQLSDNDLIKQECLQKLEYGCKNSKITIKQIVPEWTIE